MGACERCLGTNCYSSSCNFDCIDNGTWCETRVMGGGFQGVFDTAMRDKDPDYDYCEFLCQRVMRCNKAMEKAGVEIGDTVTHVDDFFFSNQKLFATAVKDLRGKRLRIIKPDGTREEIFLK